MPRAGHGGPSEPEPDVAIVLRDRPRGSAIYEGYAKLETLRDGDVLPPTQLPGIELAISDMPR